MTKVDMIVTMSTFSKTLSVLGVAAAALSFAPGASADDSASSYPTGLKPISFAATYAHDAPASGYASLSQCMNTVNSYLNLSDGNPMTFNWASGCHKMASGHYTYGSLGFTSKKTPPASVNGYRRVTNIAGLKRHSSAQYTSYDQCQSTIDSIDASIEKNGGTMISSNRCITILPNAKKGDFTPYYSYGALTYATSSYKVSSSDVSTSSPYVDPNPTYFNAIG